LKFVLGIFEISSEDNDSQHMKNWGLVAVPGYQVGEENVILFLL
jgi:hypothetical protein